MQYIQGMFGELHQVLALAATIVVMLMHMATQRPLNVCVCVLVATKAVAEPLLITMVVASGSEFNRFDQVMAVAVLDRVITLLLAIFVYAEPRTWVVVLLALMILQILIVPASAGMHRLSYVILMNGIGWAQLLVVALGAMLPGKVWHRSALARRIHEGQIRAAS